MSAIHGVLSGVITIILMVVFVAIWFWAWRPRHRKTFDELAELPLEDLSGSSEIPAGSGPTGRRREAPPAGGAMRSDLGDGRARPDQARETGTQGRGKQVRGIQERGIQERRIQERRIQERKKQERRMQDGMGWRAGPQWEQSR